MTTQTAERLDRTVFFGSAEVQGAGTALSGGSLTCVFGSAQVDLRAAELVGEGTLELFVLFGSLELRVPASWRVVMDVQPIFGSAEEGGVPPSLGDAPPTLRVRGTVIFGSAELERF